jgi:hypothetical protein
MEKLHVRHGWLVAVAFSGACLAACGGDDNAGTGAGGAGGSTTSTTGSAGSGGSTTSGAGGTSTGGSGGKGGSAGAGTDAGDAKGDCNTPGVTHTAPTTPDSIKAPTGTTLIGGYHASGNQIYTCTPPLSDAGSGDSGDAAAAPAGTWVNTAIATLTGDNCTVAATHSYTAPPPFPQWVASDGSAVVAKRYAAVPAPVPDGGDGGATAISWVLLQATSNSGTGVFANVTWVQRVDTAGGLGPSGACVPGDASPPQQVPYTATYYFYTGTASEGGAAEGGDSSTTDSALPEASTTDVGTTDARTTDSATTEAGAD